MINAGNISTTTLPALSNSSAVNLCTVPPGPGTVLITNNCGATVYIAVGATATTSDGFAIATGTSVTIPTYAGSKGGTVSVIAGTAPTASAPLSWLISTGS